MPMLRRCVTDIGMPPPMDADEDEHEEQIQQPRLQRHQSQPIESDQLPIAARTKQEQKWQKEQMATSKKDQDKLPERYQVQQMIGRGSYGCVIEAFDRERGENGKLVAIKRVSNLFRDSIDCKRILREITIMSKLDHPNIVKLYDLPPISDVHSFDQLYMVLELCDADLGKLLRADVSLSALHVTTLLYNLLLGLKYLHSAGIYHRDLKPANCLVNKDCTVKICDFGLSRAVGEHPQNSDDEHAGKSQPASLKRNLTNHVATRWYRAPELILLQEDYTDAVDMWSVGCIWAELLGMLPGMKPDERQPLFPGTSCFPLSPNQAHATDFMYHTQENHEQLNMIFDALGKPSAEDIAFLQREDAKRYLSCFRHREGAGLRKRFPTADGLALDALEDMVRFVPDKRPTVKQLLDTKLFSKVRDVKREISAPKTICLDFETCPHLDEMRLRSHFCRQITGFNRGGC